MSWAKMYDNIPYRNIILILLIILIFICSCEIVKPLYIYSLYLWCFTLCVHISFSFFHLSLPVDCRLSMTCFMSVVSPWKWDHWQFPQTTLLRTQKILTKVYSTEWWYFNDNVEFRKEHQKWWRYIFTSRRGNI